ncbi:MAG: transposase [Phycisphaeraceae bacterium]|nr:integrase core domain-containing protein [Phycisphaerales bacterium]MCB9859259.1 transposase [Phycisphaeraceae bacterium]
MRKPGRPRVMEYLRKLVVQMATDNDWGYERIIGELKALGHRVSSSTVANILHEHGIDPAPERSKRTTWRKFLKTHWSVLAATDFFTVEVWTPRGLTRFWVLFVIELESRRVEVAGITSKLSDAWMQQIARNLTDVFDGFLLGKRFLIHDRDPMFTMAFQRLLRESGIGCIRLPPRSPNLNAYAERFVLSIKSECLNHMILFGERQLRHAIVEYVEHYNAERPHQGLGNVRIGKPSPPEYEPSTEVGCSERLGGLLARLQSADLRMLCAHLSFAGIWWRLVSRAFRVSA